MSRVEYESIPIPRREKYLERVAGIVNDIGPQVELEAIGVTAEQMAYVGRHFANSAECMVALPSEEWELQVIERNDRLGTATLSEYIMGIICAGEADGSIPPEHPQPAGPDYWYGI